MFALDLFHQVKRDTQLDRVALKFKAGVIGCKATNVIGILEKSAKICPDSRREGQLNDQAIRGRLWRKRVDQSRDVSIAGDEW